MISRGAPLKRIKVIRARKSFYIVGVGASAGATFVQTPSDAQFDNMLCSAINADGELTPFTQVVALQALSNARDK